MKPQVGQRISAPFLSAPAEVKTFEERSGYFLLPAQSTWMLPVLMTALDQLLGQTEAGAWTVRARGVNEWRES